MATFISLISYTERGIADVKDSPKRLDAAREAFQRLGVELKDFYLTMGQYDIVVITDAPDAKSAARALLAVGSQGNVRTTTLQAFDEDEFRDLIASLP